MTTEMDTNDENLFRPVNLKYLKGEIQEHLEIFYKTVSFGNTQFVKLVSADPENQEKAQQLVAEKEGTEDFFIKKEDVGKYFNQATSQLRSMMDDAEIPLLEKTKKAYEISTDLMKDFFVLNGSVDTLKSSDRVVETMGECLSDADANFHSIFTITAKNYYTYTHSVNVGLYCLAYGVKTGMNDEDIRDLGIGGMLHDVGKSRVAPKILNKNSGLTDEEFSQAKGHSAYGQEMLEAANCFSTRIIEMAGLHHENYDGTGYPNGLAGKDIPHFARICKVADVYDALTTHRSYKRAMTPYDALIVMGKKMKREFDLETLGNFIRFMGPEA